jgi:glycosyltransferase involved in cell wall biosynthesis
VSPGGDKFIVYDCIDDDPAFDGHEELMLSRADLVICVSGRLLEKHGGQHSRLLLLSNGVEWEHYQAGHSAVPEELRRMKQERKVIVGFTGAFYQGWVDMELVYQMARLRPQWVFIVIGESYQWDFNGAPPNIVYFGPRPYQQLPGYVSCFDVGWIPFLDNRIARGADPVKLYEYAAAGIPVISRALPFIDGINPPLIYGYQNGYECLASINQALNDNRKQPNLVKKLRQDFAAGHSWDSKVQVLLDEVGKLTWLETGK